jgi:hypothetical protein
MSSSLHRTGTLLGLVLVLWGGLSWGQLPMGNDISDTEGNTGGGTGALQANTTGSANTAYGAAALFSNTTGGDNTAYGAGALQNTTGGDNTASGTLALARNTTGTDNIALGVQAGFNLTDGSANIYLGHPGEATESNTMRLGEAQTRTFIAGVAGTPLSSGAAAVFISPTGQLGTQPSSARYKRDIEPMGTHSQGLFQLRPVTFRYRQDASGERQYGLIAEEVATVYPELVIRRATGEVESVRYEALVPLLLHALQHQQQQMADQQRQVAELQAQNAALAELRAQNAALAARLERLEAAAARATAVTSR